MMLVGMALCARGSGPRTPSRGSLIARANIVRPRDNCSHSMIRILPSTPRLRKSLA